MQQRSRSTGQEIEHVAADLLENLNTFFFFLFNFLDVSQTYFNLSIYV